MIVGVWIVLGVVGLGFALDAWVVARDDCRLVLHAQRAKRRAGDGDGHAREFELERELAGGDLAGARWGVVLESAFVIAGIAATLSPTPQHTRTVGQWAVIVLLFVAEVALPARLFGARRRRHRLIDRADA